MTYPIHADDMPSPRFGGWADDFNTYTDACTYYGCDTPEQLAAEAEYDRRQAYIYYQDILECEGVCYGAWAAGYAVPDILDCPF